MVTAVLSVSGPSLKNCETVVSALRDVGVVGDVTHNKSVDALGRIEDGCRILIANDTVKMEKTRALWSMLQSKHSLTCAHVSQSVASSGCVMDVFAPSRCPDK